VVCALPDRPEFKHVPTGELICRATVRLELARLGSIKGTRITDPAMAIAVLIAMVDRTEQGM
jgi:hypothetical protein